MMRLLKNSALMLALIVALWLVGSGVAQDEPQPPTATGPVSISSFEPTQILNTDARTLSVFGANFASSTTIRVVGVGILSTSFINSSSLTASLPANLPPGGYTIQVVDATRGTATAGIPLTIFGPTPTPFPISTFQPPTFQPGQPTLIIRNFSADPEAIAPGESVALTFEVVNVGSRPAEGITILLGEGSFTPALGQASVTIPTINPGGTFNLSLTVSAAASAEPGPATIPIVLTFRDFEGEQFTSNATLSVTILDIEEASQVTITGYSIEPDPVDPGQPALLRVDVTNSGNLTATRALLRVAGENSILLAGERGDSLPLGDIPAGETVTAELPMIVNASAEPGPKSQAIALTFFQNDELQEVNSNITIRVANPTSALLLLEAYSTGEDVLKPGDQFTLTLALANVGDAPASNALITFGTVTSTGGVGGTPDPNSGGSTTTDGIPGNAFAPLGSGNTIFIGTIAAGGALDVEQAFIVNGTVRSGIYNLPITVRYRTAAGTTAQENLQASVVVVAPPRLQPTLLNPLPEVANVGETIPLTLELVNNGAATVDLTRVVISVNNGEIVEGAEQELSPLRTERSATIDVIVLPSEEGTFTVTFEVFYQDDLANERNLELVFETEAVIPPPMPEFTPPPDFFPTDPTPEPEDDLLSRLLLGFLGLGS